MRNAKLDEADKAIGDILGIVNCIKILSDIDKFRHWLTDYHKVTDDRELLEGYEFTLDVLIGMLYWDIGYNRSLNLSEDAMLSRALFAGIPIRKVPNSCEKAIVLRNIYYNARGVLRSTTWEDAKINLTNFWVKVLSVFEEIGDATAVSRMHDVQNIETAITYACMFQVYIFLNDTHRGHPHGRELSWFDKGMPISWGFRAKRRAYYESVFQGYKYCVQFLWRSLLGKEFGETFLTDLHKAHDWQDFDQFFDRIQTGLINPLEKRVRANLGFDSLIVIKNGAKNLIKGISQFGPPETRLSQKDELDRLFYWYEIELIDASESGFSGVASFVPLLIGTVQLRKKLKQEGKIRVMRLIHPTSNVHRRDYSYAILIEAVGSLGISDYSGWMLFYDCCSDGGSTAPMHDFAEQCIEDYIRKGTIEVVQKRVSKEHFLTMMRHRLISMTKEEMYELERTRPD